MQLYLPDDLYADRGYDSEGTRALLRWLGIEPHIARRHSSQVALRTADDRHANSESSPNQAFDLNQRGKPVAGPS
jgi:IS5 family transposase